MDAPSRQSQISEQCTQIEIQLKRYEELLARAQDRLASILGTAMARPVGNLCTDKNKESLCGLADRLSSTAKLLREKNDTLESVIDRCEN
jgi:hypothetical protein